MKSTRSPLTTTEDVYWSGTYVDYETDFLFGDSQSTFVQTMIVIYPYCKQVYAIAAFVNFFVNLPHLIILTQKELRSNLVYIVMMGICLADLMHSVSKMAAVSMMWSIFYTLEECVEGYPYFHIMVDILAKTIQIISRRCAGILALFIAAFRAFSVIFPMSNAVNLMMKAKSGYLIVLLIASLCTGWGLFYYLQTHITFNRNCRSAPNPTYKMYRFVDKEKWETRYRMIDGSLSFAISLLYVFVAIALIIALCQAKKRRKGLKNDKGNNTSMLVSFMAVSLFISEAAYGSLFILNFLIVVDTYEESFIQDLEVIALILVILNSIAHCFTCFFMSSQYRDVVKRLICCWKSEKKEEKIAVVESAAHPTTVDSTKTSKTSGSSKKAY